MLSHFSQTFPSGSFPDLHAVGSLPCVFTLSDFGSMAGVVTLLEQEPWPRPADTSRAPTGLTDGRNSRHHVPGCRKPNALYLPVLLPLVACEPFFLHAFLPGFNYAYVTIAADRPFSNLSISRVAVAHIRRLSLEPRNLYPPGFFMSSSSFPLSGIEHSFLWSRWVTSLPRPLHCSPSLSFS